MNNSCKNNIAYNKKIYLGGLIGRKTMTYTLETCFHAWTITAMKAMDMQQIDYNLCSGKHSYT